MNATRFVGLRGTKSRLFLYCGALLFLALVVYMYHGCQLQLEELRERSEKCHQQEESLSAQLQVIFEYKIRLEKSLQQEKNDHQQMKEDLQSKVAEEKILKDKTLLESMNKYTSLQQQHKLLKSEHDDLDEECNKVRIAQLQGLEEKSRLETQVQAIQQELEQIQAARGKDLEDLKSHYMQLEAELEKVSLLYKDLSSNTQQSTNSINYLQKQNLQLERELAQSKDRLKTCQRKTEVVVNPAASPARKTTTSTASGIHILKPGLNAGVGVPSKDSGDKGGSKSTTPQVNPEAIRSQDQAVASANNAANNNVVPMPSPAAPPSHGEALPLGVVPAPHVSANKPFKQSLDNEPDPKDGWNWNYKKTLQHPDNVQHSNLLRYQYLNNVQQHGDMNNQHDLNNHIQQPPALNDQHELNNLQYVNNVQQPPALNDQHDLNNPQYVNNVQQPPALNNQHDLDNPQYLNNVQQPPAMNDPHDLDNLVGHQAVAAKEKVHRNVANRGNGMLGEQRPRNPHNIYPYHGDYEKDGEKNDLHLEEAEDEGDDDLDQLEYDNDGARQSNNVKDAKRRVVNMEDRGGVMVNPK